MANNLHNVRFNLKCERSLSQSVQSALCRYGSGYHDQGNNNLLEGLRCDTGITHTRNVGGASEARQFKSLRELIGCYERQYQ
jgi:hypothetical protein